MKGYSHKEIEKKWQDKWEREELYKTLDEVPGKDNFYTSVEFPYPSGNLHVGHWYAFAVPDIFARYHRLNGKNVLYPIGFDSFGLPAENAAIKNDADPKEWTYNNIDFMRNQLKTMGNSFDWSREIITSDPEYYRWNQWLFNKFYENNLVYKGKRVLNWDPVDQTVLADEQVLPDGTAERSGAKVEKKEMEQWMFKITEYADRLIEDLEGLDWPKEIKEAQKNWIGKSIGSTITFTVKDLDVEIKVFTTRADTLFGATYTVLGPENKLIDSLNIENRDEVNKYIALAKDKSEIERTGEGKEKSGVKLLGVKAVNPANGEELPIFVADYVLGHYGTGAIMGVPAHDYRDYDFAKKYNMEIRDVVSGRVNSDESYVGNGELINSGEFDGLTIEDGKKKITEFVNGEFTTTFKLRDWIISRQRYWGTPIPMVYDPEGNVHPIPDEHLPWVLPTDVDYQPKGTSPLGSSKELVERTERIFGKGWRPETDTMDTFMDSSWYYLRYLDPKNDKEFSSLEKQKLWMPMNLYSGGSEHTNMHVLYSRFFYKALSDFGLVTENEPYKRRMNRGLIMAEDGRKMSKRWGNIIDPDELVEKIGADTVKMYLAFIGPYNEVGFYPWDKGGVVGIRRFLEKVWNIQDKIGESQNEEVEKLLHKTIKKVGEDIEVMKFNTAISQIMILMNVLEKEEIVSLEAYKTLLTILAPFAPHMTEEIWSELENKTSIHLETWPQYDKNKVLESSFTIPVQVNGKVRSTLTIAANSSEEEVKIAALEEENVKKWIGNEEIKKTIYVQNRVINFLVDSI